MKIFENFTDIPEEIQRKFKAEIVRFTPMERFEYIIHVGKKVGASDVHIIPVDYDKDNKEKLVKIKFRIDGDLDNYIYNLFDEYLQDIRSYIRMDEYSKFVYAIKDSIGLIANDTYVPGDAKYTFEHMDVKGNITSKTKLRINVMPTGVEIADLSDNKNKVALGLHQCITCRIISDKFESLPTFQNLELIPSISEKLKGFLSGGNGSLLVSGPTGSGKSVMLQILLGELAEEKIKISTLEDPIEYINPLLVQTQISKKKKFDWVDGLMALMRQDPDIIMVGEIRDEEVAKIALEISATGHMLFSTTHARSGVGTYDRFRQMGIPPYIISGITVSVGARLSKRMCPHCKLKISDKEEKSRLNEIYDIFFAGFDFTNYTPEDLCFFIRDEDYTNIDLFRKFINELRRISNELSICTNQNQIDLLLLSKNQKNKDLHIGFKEYFINNSFRRNPDGCPKCYNKGTKGRIGVHEFIFMTKNLEKLILDDKPQKHIEDYVRKENVMTLDRNGIIKMMRGDIDYEELIQLNINND